MKKTKQILIIEDNKSLRLLIGHYLSKSYEVVTKNNGLLAMQWLKEGHFPDLILLDLMMPEMTGSDFLEGLQTSGFFGNIPVIIISGNNRNILTTDVMMNVLDYFEKPFDPKKLQEKIETIFTRKNIQLAS